VSEKSVSNVIRAFGANTNRGNVKNYNEDRISIVPSLSQEYPDVSLFAIYDGHGGQGCAEYLRECMPNFIA